MDTETSESPRQSPFRWLMPVLIVAALGFSTVVIILALVGPTVGNIFSNISKGLSRDGSGGSYGGPGAVASDPGRPVPTSSSPMVAVAPVNQQPLNSMKAGEIDDNVKWDTYGEFRRGYINRYGTNGIIDFDVTGRRIIKVVDATDQPIMGAHVEVFVDNMRVSDTLTYATGLTLFFPNADDRSKRRDQFQISITVDDYQISTTLDMNAVGDVFEVQIPLVMIENANSRYLATFTPDAIPTSTKTPSLGMTR